MRNITKLWTIAAGAFVALVAVATPPQAGEYGCDGGECIDQPVLHRTFKRRVVLERGAYEIAREPSLYGTATRRVLLDSGIEWREEPAIYKTVRVRQRIPSRVVWEKRWINDKYVMCKVRVPGQTVWTERSVLVSPGRHVKVRSAPIYGYEQKRILLRPYKNIAIYQRPVTRYVRDRVTIQPEASLWEPIYGSRNGQPYRGDLLR